MLICNEGPPRAGKSYDAVKTHVLAALKAERKVYARLNGLDHEKIAAYLEMDLERVRELLITVKPEDVLPLFVCQGDDPPRFQIEANALVVIDEVHEFYVSSRSPLPREQEAFFAKHGHIGLDILIMTQALGRLHSSIRQRIERKSVFTKLNALGKEDRYAVRFYSVGDTMGKFEKISSETHDYEPAIYPLYKGFQPEATNTGAYKAGSKNVWDVIRKPAILVSIAVLAGVASLVWFFMGGDIVKEPPTPAKAVAENTAPVATGATPVTQQAPPKPVDEMAKLPFGIRHLLELGRSARPRYLGLIGHRHLVEWRTPQGSAIERLTDEQLVALGWRFQAQPFGAVARYEKHVIVFTAWPNDPPGTQSSATANRIRSAAGSLPSDSEEASRSAASAPTAGAVIEAPGGSANSRGIM